MQCPSCQSDNDDAAEVCFHCRAVLSAVTRGTVIASRYRVVAPLGRGGMGAVYRAHDEVLDDEVALKILRPEVAGTPEMAARFRSEIKLARKVSHWNVCRIHEYGEDGGLQYISMELITRATLKDRLRAGPLPPDKAFDVSIQIAEGLAAIHKVGIIHRDLKSPNVMIDDEGTAKVMDFGIAKPASAGTDGASTGYVLGSPEYMSPEQARGRRADFRSDLYSLGSWCSRPSPGACRFAGDASRDLDDARRGAAADRRSSLALPPALLPVLRSALAKDPAARFAGCSVAGGGAARGGVVGATASRRRVAACVAYGGGPYAGRWPPSGGSGRHRVRIAAVCGVAVAAALLARRAPERSPKATASPSMAVPSPPAVVPSPSPLPYTWATDRRPRLRASPIRSPARRRARVSSPERASPSPIVVPHHVAPSAPASSPSIPPRPRPKSPRPPRHPRRRRRRRRRCRLAAGSPQALGEVMVDGRVIGTTPLARFPLPPGSHSVVLTHQEYRPFTRKVEIRPGETTTIRLDFTTEGVRR
jgi:serine/threonine-protein kinase